MTFTYGFFPFSHGAETLDRKRKMEKIVVQDNVPEAEIPNMKALVLETTDRITGDIDLGQILEVSATPEEERRVLRKIDYLCVSTVLLRGRSGSLTDSVG